MTEAHGLTERVGEIISPAYLVGGSVRDALMGREFTDLDFATPLDPDSIEAAVRAAGRRPYLMGKRFGTVGFKLDGHVIEVTTFRSESYRCGSRLPDVEFLGDLEADLARRDFTINAMAMHGERLIDLFGGRDDLRRRVVRAVGDPAERFLEDPLRMLRAARFASQLDFAVDPATAAAITEHAARILSVARERWMLELDRLLVGPGVGRALGLLGESGLMRYLLPELALQREMPGAPTYPDAATLFDATIASVAAAPAESTARWSALMHDCALPYAGADAEHDRGLLGAEIVERTALHLKWPTRRREDVKRAVLGDARADGCEEH